MKKETVGVAANPLTSTAESIAHIADLLKPDFIETKTFSNNERPFRSLPHYVSLAQIQPLTWETINTPLFVNQTEKHNHLIHGVANSLGIPSPNQETVQLIITHALQLLKRQRSTAKLIFSIHGSSAQGFADMARLAHNINVPYICADFSCPNLKAKTHELIYKNPTTVEHILIALNKTRGNTPLIVKVGIYTPEEQTLLRKIVHICANHNVHAIYGINSVPMRILNANNTPAFGVGREICGVSGPPIKKLAQNFIHTTRSIIDQDNLPLYLFGCGGIRNNNDIEIMHTLGADVVMSAASVLTNAHFRFSHKTLGETYERNDNTRKSNYPNKSYTTIL